ncbi:MULTISPECIES: hypothetical protein [Bradyrhizobium]|uniref:hypothetical protein n=1 Tax=Bradyrhizobium TaxID=374 RepID=UPI001181AB30|nr:MULTISPECIES: hypothetical protein [Bradyrhizobium]
MTYMGGHRDDGMARLMLVVSGGVAEFERELISGRSRTSAIAGFRCHQRTPRPNVPRQAL